MSSFGPAGLEPPKEPSQCLIRSSFTAWSCLTGNSTRRLRSRVPYNVVVLDVTDPNAVQEIGGLKAYTFPDNRRTFIHVPEQDPNDPNFVLPRTDSSTTRKYEVRVRVTSYRLNTLPDLTGLQAVGWNIVVDKGLRLRSSSGADICTVGMDRRNDADTPVTIRLSATGN